MNDHGHARDRDPDPSTPAKPAALVQARLQPTQLALWVGLLLIGGGLILAPTSARLLNGPVGLSVAAALVAYIGRRRWADAVVLALPPLAGPWVDAQVGSHALLVTCLAAYLLTMRPRFAAVAGSVVAVLLLAGIRLKLQFAGTPLTWQDVRFFFRQFGDNVGVLPTQPTLVAYAAAIVGLSVVACVMAWRWNPPGRRVGWPAPLLAAGLAALLVAHSGTTFAREVSKVSTSGAWFVGEGLVERPAVAFFATALLEPRWGVAATDTSAFRRDSQRLLSAGSRATPADIVVFLQESQFNPATLEGCPASLCGLDAFGAGGGTVAHGPLQVHVFGGGTWLSEFAFETGVPHDAFGPAGEFAPFSISPHVSRSFVRSLKAAGYRTVALYPTRGGMMNGRDAYAGYGFDEFLDAAQLGLPEAWGTPDAQVHEAVRQVLARERQHDQPVFLFALTLFNHAEHGIDMERVPSRLVDDAATAFPAAAEARSVADYVWRSREFEREMAITRAAVLGTPRPAVLGWFGDHQPPFANATSLRARVRSVPTETGTVPAKFQTWYQVSSNRAGRAPTDPPRALDLVFLPGLLAEAAGVPIDDWLAANIWARTRCDGLLQACRTPEVRDDYLSYLRDDLGAFELP